MKAINYISQEQHRKKCGAHQMTEEERTYLKAHAINGVIPFTDFVKAATEILNREQTKIIL